MLSFNHPYSYPSNVIYGDAAHDRDPAHPQQPVKYQIYILLSQSTREILFWKFSYKYFKI